MQDRICSRLFFLSELSLSFLSVTTLWHPGRYCARPRSPRVVLYLLPHNMPSKVDILTHYRPTDHLLSLTYNITRTPRSPGPDFGLNSFPEVQQRTSGTSKMRSRLLSCSTPC
ncbi:hypothetical protein H4582DRAFT_1053072 [Lactarius indigo]|nr:hypothetical protein H4582DRAFT_1053072 [Lactarius indigo]